MVANYNNGGRLQWWSHKGKRKGMHSRRKSAFVVVVVVNIVVAATAGHTPHTHPATFHLYIGVCRGKLETQTLWGGQEEQTGIWHPTTSRTRCSRACLRLPFLSYWQRMNQGETGGDISVCSTSIERQQRQYNNACYCNLWRCLMLISAIWLISRNIYSEIYIYSFRHVNTFALGVSIDAF